MEIQAHDEVPIYKDKNQEESIRKAKQRIALLETKPLAENRAELVANIHHMMESASSASAKSWGDLRISPTGTTSTIDEDTNAAVILHAKMEDPYGDGAAIASPFQSNRISIPLDDLENKTAHYHGYYRPDENRANMSWRTVFDMPIAHTKAHQWSRAYELNIPGNSSFDKQAFIYYATNSAFDISGNLSYAIWWYPTAIAEPGETFGFLQYRYSNSTNYYAACIKSSDSKIYIFVNEAGAITKRATSATINLNAWNLLIWTYAPGTNTLTVNFNDSTSTSTPSDTLTVPYTTDSNLYFGGLPNNDVKQCEGYLGPLVGWNIILVSTQRDNFWDHGTIV